LGQGDVSHGLARGSPRPAFSVAGQGAALHATAVSGLRAPRPGRTRLRPPWRPSPPTSSWVGSCTMWWD